MVAGKIPLKGVVFDMDGTLTLPVLNFSQLRERLNLPLGCDLLDHVHSQLKGAEKLAALQTIEEFELEGEKQLEIQEDLIELIEYLDKFNLPRAIITRNNPRAAARFIEHLVRFHGHKTKSRLENFSPILARDFLPFKPNSAPILHVCQTWGVDPTQVMMIGDGWDDMMCANQAGSISVLLDHSENERARDIASFKIRRLLDVIPLIETSF